MDGQVLVPAAVLTSEAKNHPEGPWFLRENTENDTVKNTVPLQGVCTLSYCFEATATCRRYTRPLPGPYSVSVNSSRYLTEIRPFGAPSAGIEDIDASRPTSATRPSKETRQKQPREPPSGSPNYEQRGTSQIYTAFQLTDSALFP
ncbi:hypothetical protein KM043_008859 [Ampulex compressa]|nr:hypothetical protein KM043_008859 [Ampulex compressa]